MDAFVPLAMLPFFASNRREGARLLSSMLVFLAIGLTQVPNVGNRPEHCFLNRLHLLGLGLPTS